jgi:hypothetical protein
MVVKTCELPWGLVIFALDHGINMSSIEILNLHLGSRIPQQNEATTFTFIMNNKHPVKTKLDSDKFYLPLYHLGFHEENQDGLLCPPQLVEGLNCPGVPKPPVVPTQ